MQEKYIYHIVTEAEWEKQQQNEYYIHSSLELEGFIHASTLEQLDATIQRYYSNEQSVVVLTVDVSKLESELKYELAPSVNQLFPHIYGALNLNAVVEVAHRLAQSSR